MTLGLSSGASRLLYTPGLPPPGPSDLGFGEWWAAGWAVVVSWPAYVTETAWTLGELLDQSFFF